MRVTRLGQGEPVGSRARWHDGRDPSHAFAGEHHGANHRPDRLTVLFDQDCGFCTWSAEAMMRIDRGHRVRFLPLADAGSLGIHVPDRDALKATIHAVDERGRWVVGGETWITVLDRVPVTRPLAWIARLPLISRLVEPVYDRIAANRYRLSRMLGREACELPPIDGGDHDATPTPHATIRG